MKNSFDEFATFAPKFAQKITNTLCLLNFYLIRQNVLLKPICIDCAPNGAQMAPKHRPPTRQISLPFWLDGPVQPECWLRAVIAAMGWLC